MKKNFLNKAFLTLLIVVLCAALFSCGSKTTAPENETESKNDNYQTQETQTQTETQTETETKTESETVSYFVTTQCSTDDYGLAGTYTMLNSKAYNIGDKVELSATVNDGYNFEGWYVVKTTNLGYYETTELVLLSNNTSYTYTMQNKDITFTPVFSSYTITTTSTGNTGGAAGTYTVLNKKVSEGQKVTLTATVNDGYNFEGWFVNDIRVSNSLVYEYTMEKKDVEFEARYSSYTITTSSNTNLSGAAGTFTTMNNKKVSNGTTVELTATVNEGYNFEGWYIEDVCVNNNLKYTLTMEKKNIDIEAKFSYYHVSTVAYAKNSNGETETGFHAGTYTTLSKHNVSIGENITLKATVNDGYNFAGWYINDTCVSTELEYTYTMDRRNVTIAAVYVYYTLTTTVEYGSLGPGFSTDDLSTSAGQYISPVYTNQKISVGTEISLTANEITGWKFIGWMNADGGVLSYDKSFTYKMQAGDIRAIALYYNAEFI